MDNFKKALLSVITFTVFCGFIYTMVMTGICQVLFPNSANGKIIEVNAIIDKCTNHKVLGLFGEETVNVLKVNLMLDKII